jgi:hypothetical protein
MAQPDAGVPVYTEADRITIVSVEREWLEGRGAAREVVEVSRVRGIDPRETPVQGRRRVAGPSRRPRFIAGVVIVVIAVIR